LWIMGKYPFARVTVCDRCSQLFVGSERGIAEMMSLGAWSRRGSTLIYVLSLVGCASAQLNYNTLDIASTIDSLVTNQVLSNLARFIESPHAIPSQVAISTGTVSTNNTVTPSLTAPLNVATTATNTVATTVAAAVTTATTNTATGNRPNVGASLSATDQWTQTWGVSPLTDPDQLRRLRVLYQFGAGLISETDLLCNYPIIQSKGGGAAPVGTVTYPTSDGKNVTVTIGDPAKPKPKTVYQLRCQSGLLVTHPDPAFLNPPGCIICADTDEGTINLHVNRRLKNDWLRYADGPFGAPNGAISLGYHRNKYLYVDNPEDLAKFYEFSLFVLEATTLSATSATGQSAGKGSPIKTPAFITGPSILLQ
jgi:hypothetical protein